MLVISKLILVFLSLFSTLSTIICYSRPEPAWLKAGFYVEYFLDAGPMGLVVVSNSSLSYLRDYFPAIRCNGTYRFELLSVNYSFAQFNVTLNLTAWIPAERGSALGEKVEWIEFKLIQTSCIYDVDLKTLMAYKDGREVGLFPLWREFPAVSGRVPCFSNFFGKEVEGDYRLLDSEVPVETSLGKFRHRYNVVALIEKERLDLPFQINLPEFPIVLSYDRDTCLLIHGYDYTDEILLEFGILFFHRMYIAKASVEFPQLMEQAYGFEAWQMYLAIMLIGFSLPFIYRLSKRLRLLKQLILQRKTRWAKTVYSTSLLEMRRKCNGLVYENPLRVRIKIQSHPNGCLRIDFKTF